MAEHSNRLSLGGRIASAHIPSILTAWRVNAQARRQMHHRAAAVYRRYHNKLMWPQYIINAFITSSAVLALVEDLERKKEADSVSQTSAILIMVISVLIFILSMVDFMLSHIMLRMRYDHLAQRQIERATQYSKVAFEGQSALIKMQANPLMKLHEKISFLFQIMSMLNDMRDEAGQYIMPERLQQELTQAEISPTFIPRLTEEEVIQGKEEAEQNAPALVQRQMAITTMYDDECISLAEQEHVLPDAVTMDLEQPDVVVNTAESYNAKPMPCHPPVIRLSKGTPPSTPLQAIPTTPLAAPPAPTATYGTDIFDQSANKPFNMTNTMRSWYQEAKVVRAQKEVIIRKVAKNLYKFGVFIIILRSMLTFVAFVNGGLEATSVGQESSDMGQALVIIIIVISALRSALSTFMSAMKWQEMVDIGMEHDRTLHKFQQRIRVTFNRLRKAPSAYMELLEQITKRREEIIEGKVFDTVMNSFTVVGNSVVG